jgi:hypothetical protein
VPPRAGPVQARPTPSEIWKCGYRSEGANVDVPCRIPGGVTAASFESRLRNSQISVLVQPPCGNRAGWRTRRSLSVRRRVPGMRAGVLQDSSSTQAQAEVPRVLRSRSQHGPGGRTGQARSRTGQARTRAAAGVSRSHARASAPRSTTAFHRSDLSQFAVSRPVRVTFSALREHCGSLSALRGPASAAFR